MANIKSAKKRIIQNSKRADINKLRKSRIRSGIKRVHSLSSEKKKDEVTVKKNWTTSINWIF